MTTIVSPSIGSQQRASLIADLEKWTKRADLEGMIDDFIQLFENKAARKLRIRAAEAAFSGTTTADNKIILPSDFNGIKSLWSTTYPEMALKAAPLATVLAWDTGGLPTMYAVDTDSIRFNGAGEIAGVYYAGLPSLVDYYTNWLSVSHYDAYLFGVLTEAFLYVMDDTRAQMYSARTDAVLAEIVRIDQKLNFNAPMQVRVYGTIA